jgi:putative transposase
MPRQRYTTEHSINKLRQAEVLISQGRSIREVAKELTISDHTYYRWRREYGGIGTEQAKRLKMLEKENDRLKKLVADLSLDNAILRDAAEGNL